MLQFNLISLCFEWFENGGSAVSKQKRREKVSFFCYPFEIYA